MTETVIQTAAQVVECASRDKPADAVLRTELRGRSGITRAAGRAISEAVFAYYRWYRWLNQRETVAQQIRQAVGLTQSFRTYPNSISDVELSRAVPEWAAHFVDVSPAWLRALQTEPSLWLRARVGRGKELAKALGDCRPAGTGPLGDALCYQGGTDLFRTPQFHAGQFELQYLNSQIVGLVCQPQPGETWWDACAGEGGKLLHLCDLMRNQGLVWASDRAAWRLAQLKRRAARAQLFNYRSALWNGGSKLPTKTKFDGVLVDAPCSGLGTWQRNPHGRWTTRLEDVRELAELQKQLLAHAVGSLKPGGRLIYSVCTLTRAETSEVVAAMGGQFPELKPFSFPNPLDPAGAGAPQLWLWPQATGGNGMFIAAWQK